MHQPFGRSKTRRSAGQYLAAAFRALYPWSPANRSDRDEDGSALVEMAIVLPVMMAVMTGIFSFSMALYQKLQLAEAVSNAGHVLATDRGDNDPCTTATNAIYAGAPGLARSSITLTYTLNGHSYGSGTTACAAGGGAANANMVANGTAQIQATYPCALGVYGMGVMSCTISSQITENVQ